MIKRFIIVAAGISVLMFTSCASSQEKSEQQKTTAVETVQPKAEQFVISHEQFNTSGMELSTINNYTFHEKVLAQGYLDVPPSNKAMISSYFPGKINKINVLIGDNVKKGQELVRLTNPTFIELQKDFLIAKDNLEYQTKEFKRQKQLASDSISSMKVLQMAKSKYTSAMASYQDLKKKLMLLNLDPQKVEKGEFRTTVSILAPISGSVTALNVTLGTHVNSADMILEIIDNSHEHLELNVFEKDILKVKPDQRILFTIPDIGPTEYNGEVKLIGKSINSESRTIKVHGHLEQPHPRFVPGMYVNASILTKEVNRMAVPESALIKQEDNYFVLILKQKNDKGYILEKEQVTPGITEKGMVQISGNKNLKQGHQVLSKGAFYLL
jgi:cobalt-zinc-cadmium efflux system membrane fusion protein